MQQLAAAAMEAQKKDEARAQAVADAKANAGAAAARALVEAQTKADEAAARLLEAQNAAAMLEAKSAEAERAAAAAAKLEQEEKQAALLETQHVLKAEQENARAQRVAAAEAAAAAVAAETAARDAALAEKRLPGITAGAAAMASAANPDFIAAMTRAGTDNGLPVSLVKTDDGADGNDNDGAGGNNGMLLLSPLEKEQLAANMALLGIQAEDLTVYTRVHTRDLGSAILHVLWTEVHAHQPLAGVKLEIVWQLVDMLTKYVKVSPIMDNALKRLDELISQSTGLDTSKDWEAMLKVSGLPPKQPHPWVQCKGTQEWLRGYPCSLWSLFHTIMAGATASSTSRFDNQAMEPLEVTGDVEGKEALSVIARYVQTFFGCEECVNNFRNEVKAVHLAPDPTAINGAASLELWKLHNSVNDRLGSDLADESNDPGHPKVEFPSREQCPACRNPIRKQKKNG